MKIYQHYMIQVGQGELSSRFYTRACEPNRRIHVDDVKATIPPAGTPKCPDCAKVAEVLEAAEAKVAARKGRA